MHPAQEQTTIGCHAPTFTNRAPLQSRQPGIPCMPNRQTSRSKPRSVAMPTHRDTDICHTQQFSSWHSKDTHQSDPCKQTLKEPQPRKTNALGALAPQATSHCETNALKLTNETCSSQILTHRLTHACRVSSLGTENKTCADKATGASESNTLRFKKLALQNTTALSEHTALQNTSRALDPPALAESALRDR